MYHTYILESLTTKKWYYGSTGRLDERLAEHNYNNGHYSGGRGPWLLIFQRSFDTEAEARAFEQYLKKSRNKEYIRRSFLDFFIGRGS
jgi:putative endonuclease